MNTFQFQIFLSSALLEVAISKLPVKPSAENIPVKYIIIRVAKTGLTIDDQKREVVFIKELKGTPFGQCHSFACPHHLFDTSNSAYLGQSTYFANPVNF